MSTPLTDEISIYKNVLCTAAIAINLNHVSHIVVTEAVSQAGNNNWNLTAHLKNGTDAFSLIHNSDREHIIDVYGKLIVILGDTTSKK